MSFDTIDSSGRRAPETGAASDIATASLIEVWIDETDQRTWFLFEASRN